MQVTKWIGRLIGWVLLTAFQVLVLSQLGIASYVQPYVFIMFVMLLPFNTPRWIVLVLGFTSGLAVDMFNNSAGMHAACVTLLAFARPAVIRMLTPVSGYEGIEAPSVYRLGFVWFLTFTMICTGIHHIAYFSLEALSFFNLSYTLLKIGVSMLLSTFLVLNFAFLFSSRGRAERS